MAINVRLKELNPAAWSISGTALVRLGLCSTSTNFFNIAPELLFGLGYTKTSLLDQSDLFTGGFFQTTSADISFLDPVSDYTVANWELRGWTPADFGRFEQELKTWVRVNFDNRPSRNLSNADCNLLLVRKNVSGTDYIGAFIFFGNQGIIVDDQFIAGKQSMASCIQAHDGAAYMWGANGNGQLGNNTITSQTSPVSVVGGRSFNKISNGIGHAVALEGGTGNAYAWGSNTQGQLGDNTVTGKSSPISVLGGRSFTQIACSDNNFTLAIDGSGAAWAWGQNSAGALGDNTTTSKSSPVSVVGGRTFSQIQAGFGQSNAIEAGTGAIYSWGANTNGALGDNTTTNRSSPVLVVGGRSFSQLPSSGSTNNNFAAIEGATGHVYAWGVNGAGQLGDGTTTNRSSPVSVLGGRSYSRLTIGSGLPNCFHAIEGATGHAYGWGNNSFGQLGDGTFTDKTSPVSVVGSRSYVDIAASFRKVFAVEGVTGVVYCWGGNFQGIIGIGYRAGSESPVSIGRSFAKVFTSHLIDGTSGFLDFDGTVWTAGLASNGILGDGTILSKSSPVSVLGGRSYSHFSGGNIGMAAIDGADGAAYVWGQGSFGQGDNTVNNYSSPVSVFGGRSYNQISAGGSYNVAAIEAATGAIWIWGNNANGQCGNNTAGNKSTPVSVVGGRSYSKVNCGNLHNGAIDGATGAAYCWGSGTSGGLGDNTVTNRSSPVSVVGGRSYSEIACGQAFTVAIEAATGNAYAWGSNGSGQLGDNTLTNRSSPVSVVGGRSYVKISGRGFHTAAIEGGTGNAYCWGNNSDGQLGNGTFGTTFNASSPVSVLGGRSYIEITAGASTTLAVEGGTNQVYAWGANTGGEFGNGQSDMILSPTSVARIFT